ncbi:hypothetical protein [Streptomyces olivaceus]|uniref:hypothetical protein n=1 Tax=Streptomyces TaxID=1883 RepID=UPI0030C683B6
MARNLVVDDYRRRAGRPREVDAASWLDDVPAHVDDIDRLLDGMSLKDAFRSLSDKHREVLYGVVLLRWVDT